MNFNKTTNGNFFAIIPLTFIPLTFFHLPDYV